MQATRFRLALAVLAVLAGVLYLWNLTVSGYANTYYSAAALAASESWSAWFFGAFDAAGFITVDKPPLALWVMGLSVRLFGLSSWSILAPQALAGVATVVLLALTIRRSFGSLAGIVAGLAMALTPAAVLMFRYNNPDAILTLLLVGAAAALLHGLETDRLRWTLLSAALVGAAFLTKYLQAYVVLPAFALTYLLATHGDLRRRLVGLLAAGATVFVTSAWWVAIVEAIPASARPFIGGSTTNSALELLLGYDGLGRIFGGSLIGGSRPVGADGGLGIGLPGGRIAGGAGPGFGGESGLFRMFNDTWAGHIAWLLPLALVALVIALVQRRRGPRTDPRLAAVILWGGWLVTHALVFSFMGGIAHPYYAVALAPAIAALVGIGFADLPDLRARHPLAGLALGAGVAASAITAAIILGRTPDFVPWLGPIVVTLGLAAGVLLALPSFAAWPRASSGVTALALVAVLAGPAAYAGATMTRAHAGGDPTPGPASAARLGDGPGPGGGFGQPGGGFGQPGGGLPGGGFGQPSGGLPGAGGVVPGGGDRANTALVEFLLTNRGTETWIVAMRSAMQAGMIQLATGAPVMAIGGFSGGDPVPTLDELRTYVAEGKLRFVMLGGGLGGGFGRDPGAPNGGLPGAPNGGLPGLGSTSMLEAWVAESCTPVTITGTTTSLYDCAGAAA